MTLPTPCTESSINHGKVICRQCGTTISQCRCIEGHRNITYIDRCASCREVPKP
jgi:hypothetical protein